MLFDLSIDPLCGLNDITTMMEFKNFYHLFITFSFECAEVQKCVCVRACS